MEKLILTGLAASAGIAEGVVKVVDRRSHTSVDFEEGGILVTEMTEPAMVMLMNKAAGIVTDVGGITSHAAIVSRELGIPCITAAKTATKDLKDGMRVRLNGSNGEVTLLDI
jgi:phosphoenolpyruvate synthase/pyruvate phosphate dikinase